MRAISPSSRMISQMTPAGCKAGEAGEIDGGFGLPGADQDAALAGAQGKDVAGADEIGWRWHLGRWRCGWCGRGRLRRCRW